MLLQKTQFIVLLLAQLAELIIYSYSKPVCLFVNLMMQITTTARRDYTCHEQFLQTLPSWNIDLPPENSLNSPRENASWASQPLGCLLLSILLIKNLSVMVRCWILIGLKSFHNSCLLGPTKQSLWWREKFILVRQPRMVICLCNVVL